VTGPTAGPNLLLVVVDTLRADVVGAWGDDGGLTPNLDELARRSVRFADLTAPSSWTLPSVATLLTGQPPQVHGAGRRVGDFAPTALGDEPPTLAETLAGNGFYTAGVYNNIYMNPSFGLEQGFDEYAWVEAEDAAVVDRALERLEELADRRHFLLVHLFGPHHPYEPPRDVCWQVAPRFAPGYEGDLGCSYERRDVPTLDGVVPPRRDRRWIEALYRAEVAETDRQLGRLLAGVRELGLADDTVVAVVSDHGEAFFDRLDQLSANGYVPSDHGNTLFRELLHVPALVHAPGLEPAVSPHPAELADLYPTLLRLLGFEPPPVTGRDLLAELTAGPEGRRTRLAGFLLYGPDRWSARRGPWKLVAPAADGAAGEATAAAQLYDLDADPGELRDVAALHPDVAARLAALAETELARRAELRRRFLAGEEDVLNAAYLEWVHVTKLRALGYLK
jgi:arylsulfatase A-like enzyme